MFTHIWACGFHIRPNEAKWSKAKHRHSKSLGCRRLMGREANWGVCGSKHQVPFSMQIDLFLRNVAAQLYDVGVVWPLFLKVSETALETGKILQFLILFSSDANLTTPSIKRNDFFVCVCSVSSGTDAVKAPTCSANIPRKRSENKKVTVK